MYVEPRVSHDRGSLVPHVWGNGQFPIILSRILPELQRRVATGERARVQRTGPRTAELVTREEPAIYKITTLHSLSETQTSIFSCVFCLCKKLLSFRYFSAFNVSASLKMVSPSKTISMFVHT